MNQYRPKPWHPASNPENDAGNLPVHAHLDAITELLASRRSLVLSAEPGAGKTSLVPLALARSKAFPGKILVTEPRRIACIGAATRAASLLGEETGARVGYRVRHDSRVSSSTRIEFLTEGILVRMVQEDPSLEGVDAVVFDEFHERSLAMDLAFAFTREARTFSPALAILVMSATLDTTRIARVLDAPVYEVPGRQYPVTILHGSPGLDPVRETATLTVEAMDRVEGDILAFLPGQAEIGIVERLIREESFRRGIQVLPLAASLPLEQQRRILNPDSGRGRRIILSTSVAESSITVPRIEAVVDSGLARLTRLHSRTGLNALVTERESADRASQRSGRAGRLGPGLCFRAFPADAVLRERTEPEILRSELSSLVLESALRGAKAALDLPWLDAPDPAAWENAVATLKILGLLDDSGSPTARGRDCTALGLEPRLGAVVLAGLECGRLGESANLAALLSLKIPGTPGQDLHDAIVRMDTGQAEYARAREEAAAIRKAALKLPGRRGMDPRQSSRDSTPGPAARQSPGTALHPAVPPATPSATTANRVPGPELTASTPGRLLAAGFPDRIAQRVSRRVADSGSGSRAGSTPGESFKSTRSGYPAVVSDFMLPSGRLLQAGFPLSESEWIIAADADPGGTGPASKGGQGRVYSGIALTESDAVSTLAPFMREELRIEWDLWIPRARILKLAGALILSRVPAARPGIEILAAAVCSRLRSGGLSLLPWEDSGAGILLERGRWFSRHARKGSSSPPSRLPSLEDEDLLSSLESWLVPFISASRGPVIDGAMLKEALLHLLGREGKALLDREAPASLELPSGSTRPIQYGAGPEPVLEARVQEFFGLSVHPKVAGIPLVLRLLTPAMRPLQVTSDLPGFWKGSWAEARAELKGRYPKHDWPVDPGKALPSRRGLKGSR